MDNMISKNYRNTHFGTNPTIDAKIAIFRDRVLGWQIEIAEAMNPIQHAGYGMISVLFSYFEMIAQYCEGKSSKSQSGAF